jgi:hypothetical protein
MKSEASAARSTKSRGLIGGAVPMPRRDRDSPSQPSQFEMVGMKLPKMANLYKMAKFLKVATLKNSLATLVDRRSPRWSL